MTVETNQTENNLSNNHVVGVIDGEQAAQDAAQELIQAGYIEPIVLTGEEGAKQVDAKGENNHVFARILSAVHDHLSEATNYMRQYEEEARNGRYIVAVEAESREAAERAQEVLTRHGAENIRYFGKLAIADMTPETNPSLRSEESAEPQEET